MGLTQKGFTLAYAMLSSEFKGELTEMQAETHRQMLIEDGVTDDELISGVKSIIRNRKFANFPKYAELIEAIKGNPDDEALIALKELEDAMGIFGAYKSVIFKNKLIMACVEGMGGWQRICQMPLDEWKFKNQEFLKLYRAYTRGGKYPQVDYLIGIAEQKNRFEGYLEDADETPVHLVGYEPNYPKALPALTIKTNIGAQKQAIENRRDITKMITVKGMGC